MSKVQNITVAEADSDMRIDRWFRQYFPQVRHGQLERMLRKGNIRVDGGRVKANHRLETGAVVRVPPVPEESAPSASSDRKRLSDEDAAFIQSLVIHEDHHIIALNKPFGLAVQGGAGTNRHIDGLLDGLVARNTERPRLIHRLDKDTGGVLIIGKNRKSTAFLAEAFQKHAIEKEYWALCTGVPSPHQGTINLPIAKKMQRVRDEEQERMVPASGEQAKRAITDFQVVEQAAETACFLALRPLTGRTHQLRVHTAAIGHPIVGDGKYGGSRARLEGVDRRMHLFCRKLTVPNPAGGRPIQIKADLAGHMAASWKFFGFMTSPEIDWPEVL